MDDHGKGVAAIQIFQSGIILVNWNTDNIDLDFEVNVYLIFNNRSKKIPGIKAVLIKSFGFGQVDSEAFVIHPDHLFATLNDKTIPNYKAIPDLLDWYVS